MNQPIPQRPSGVNVGVFNPGEIVYIKGREDLDGSIRYILNPNDKDITLEQRKSGVWNPTALRLSGNTLFLDRQLALASAGFNLEIVALGPGRTFLANSVEFDDTGTFEPRSQLLDPLVTDEIIQGVFDTDIKDTVISGSTAISISRLISVVHLKTGSTAATSDVKIIMSTGLTTGGTIIIDFNFPASQFPANSDITLDLETVLGVLSGDEITFGFFSDEDFSLLGDSSDEIFFSIDSQLLDSIEISTVNGNAVAFVEDLSGVRVSVTTVNVWNDISDGGVDLIWALGPSLENFTLTDINTGEITYGGLVDAGLRLGGSVNIDAMAGMIAIEIGISINGAAPTEDTITRGFVTPTQLDSVTISPAKVALEIGDTLKLQFRNLTDSSDIIFYQAKNVVF